MNIATAATAEQTVLPLKRQRRRTQLYFRAWGTWLIAASFLLFQLMLQLSAGVMVHDLMQSYSLTALGAGLLAGTYYYIYSALQTPAGMLMDHFGARKLLTIGAVICSIGCVIFAVSGSVSIAVLGRLLMGLGSSFAFVGCLFLIGVWFPFRYFAVMVALTETIAMIGSIGSNLSLATLDNVLGWRNSMLIAGVIAAGFAVLCWLFVKDTSPLTRRQQHLAPSFSLSHFYHNVWALLKKPVVWLNGLYIGLLFTVVTVFVALWGIPFFEKAHHIAASPATFSISLVFLGIAIGGPLIGWFYGLYPRRRLILIGGALMSAALLSVLIYMPSLPMAVTDILLFMLGLSCSCYILNYVIAKEVAVTRGAATSIGFTNTLAVVTAPIFQSVVGLILYLVARGHSLTGHEIYTVHSYQLSLSILPVMLIIAALLAVFIPEQKHIYFGSMKVPTK